MWPDEDTGGKVLVMMAAACGIGMLLSFVFGPRGEAETPAPVLTETCSSEVVRVLDDGIVARFYFDGRCRLDEPDGLVMRCDRTKRPLKPRVEK